MKVLFIFLFLIIANATHAQVLNPLKTPFPMPNKLTWQNERSQNESITSHQGNVVLLNLWASWCAPCVYELPQFDKLQNRYKSAGFKVIASTADDPLEMVKSYFNRYGINI